MNALAVPSMLFKMLFNPAILRCCAFFAALTLSAPAALLAQQPFNTADQAAIVEHLGQRVNLDLRFTDAAGRSVALKDLINNGRPVILTPVYYECPQLCTLTLNGTFKLLNALDLRLGQDYSVITVSFDPAEETDLARAKANAYHKQLKDPQGARHWTFLTGEQDNVGPLMEQLGFRYSRDGTQWIHAAAIMVLTPDGVVSRYFYGIEYKPKDVRYALVEAGKGAIGDTLDRVFLYCFRYDPKLGKYTPMIWRITRIVCLSVLAALILFIGTLKLRERRQSAGERTA